MPTFVWNAETKKGEAKKGEIDAANEARNLRIYWNIFPF
jgi:hypothetical protein